MDRIDRIFIVLSITVIFALGFSLFIGSMILESIDCRNLCEESNLDYLDYRPDGKVCSCEKPNPNIIRIDMGNSKSEV